MGILPEREALAKVAEVDTHIEEVSLAIDARLVASPIAPHLLEDAQDWRAWTPGQRRAFLRLAIARVVVDEWPSDLPASPFRKRGEDPEAYATRKAQIRMAGARQRTEVFLKWAP